MTEHKLLVYGTLKRNLYNHHHLRELYGDSKFIKNAITRFPLYYMKENGGFPAVFHKRALGQHISGELYSISEKILAHCDMLERHPVWYQRRKVSLMGEEEECWMYIMRDKYIENFPIEVKKEHNTQRF